MGGGNGGGDGKAVGALDGALDTEGAAVGATEGAPDGAVLGVIMNKTTEFRLNPTTPRVSPVAANREFVAFVSSPKPSKRAILVASSWPCATVITAVILTDDASNVVDTCETGTFPAKAIAAVMASRLAGVK